MHKIILSIIASVVALPAFAMILDEQQEYAPDSMKGKRITFFFSKCRCRVETNSTSLIVETPPGVTVRYVNFNYGNTSTGKNGGSMVYTKDSKTENRDQGIILTDDRYSGSGYRVQGNPQGDSGEWHLFFEDADHGSAWFMGHENGVPTYYDDVPFVITPVNQDAAKPERISAAPRTAPQPGKAGCAPESMADMVITLIPREEQKIENEDWAMIQMYFGWDYIQEGVRRNHVVATRGYNEAELRYGNWMNAYCGETERCLYPGYYDYVKQPDGTARIQLSGESSANAYYTLHFDSPTSGTLTYHHEDVVDNDLKVIAHIEGIPFKVTHRDYTNPATLKRGDDPENADSRPGTR